MIYEIINFEFQGNKKRLTPMGGVGRCILVTIE